MSVTWLHISDFHFKAGDPYDRDVVLHALIQSIRYFHEQGRRPDLIFATGDIAHSGKSEEYELATKFFDEILEATSLTRDRLFVVPGNHDIDREIGKRLPRTLDTNEEATGYFRPNTYQPHFNKLASYQKWYDAYFSGIRKFPSDTTCTKIEYISINGQTFEILLINSALFAQDDHDHGKLWLGRRCLDEVLPKHRTNNNSIRLTLLHHPLDWLHEKECANIESKLTTYSDLILRGHLHKTDIKRIALESASVLQFAAGAAYQTKNYPNKAMYGTVNGVSVEIFPIRYEDEPEEIWTLDTSVFPKAPGYIRHFKLPDKSTPSPAKSIGNTDLPAQETIAADDDFSELPADHELLLLADELLSASSAHAFFEALQKGYEKHLSGNTVPVNAHEMVKQFAKCSPSRVKNLFFTVRRGLEIISSTELDLPTRAHINKTAGVLYLLAACRLISSKAHAKAVTAAGTCDKIIHAATNIEMVCAVIATALFGGEIQVVLSDDDSYPVPKYTFKVKNQILDDYATDNFERAAYVAILCNSKNSTKLALDTGPLTNAERQQLQVKIDVIREYEKSPLTLILNGDFSKDACNQFANNYLVPVVIPDSEFATNLLGISPDYLNESIKEFWVFKDEIVGNQHEKPTKDSASASQ